jgi:hypothetical protein
MPVAIDYPPDEQWQEGKIAQVRRCSDGWELKLDDGWSLWVDNYSAEPKPGDTIRTYGKGVGFEVRGVFIAGVRVRYESESQYADRMYRERAEREVEQRVEYAGNRDEYTARINALPGPLQKRLFQFRERSPDFGWKFEGYELACAEATAQVATACERREAVAVREWLDDFKARSWGEQTAIAPLLNDLSGNMHQFVIRQAHLLLTSPDLVPQDHGALCLLVGCESFKACDAHHNKLPLRRK